MKYANKNKEIKVSYRKEMILDKNQNAFSCFDTMRRDFFTCALYARGNKEPPNYFYLHIFLAIV